MTDPIRNRVRVAVTAALDKKASDLTVLAVGDLTSIADYFILTSASNERQATAIADSIEERLREELQVRPFVVEGATSGRWVLLDYGDFIVHVFTDETRRFYGLERLWGDAPNLTSEFTDQAESPAPRRALKKTS